MRIFHVSKLIKGLSCDDFYNVDYIANSLSKICRYGGQLPKNKFYSVAEHSVLTARIASSLGYNTKEIASVFLHDTPEAYLGDILGHLKKTFKAYLEVEEVLENILYQRFNVKIFKEKIKVCDKLALRVEKDYFFPEESDEVFGLENIHFPSDVQAPEIDCYEHKQAKNMFILYSGLLGIQ